MIDRRNGCRRRRRSMTWLLLLLLVLQVVCVWCGDELSSEYMMGRTVVEELLHLQHRQDLTALSVRCSRTLNTTASATHSYVYYLCGRAFQAVRNYDSAYDAFRQAIRSNPVNAKAFVAIGDVALQQLDFQNALYSYEIAAHKLGSLDAVSQLLRYRANQQWYRDWELDIALWDKFITQSCWNASHMVESDYVSKSQSLSQRLCFLSRQQALSIDRFLLSIDEQFIASNSLISTEQFRSTFETMPKVYSSISLSLMTANVTGPRTFRIGSVFCPSVSATSISSPVTGTGINYRRFQLSFANKPVGLSTQSKEGRQTIYLSSLTQEDLSAAAEEMKSARLDAVVIHCGHDEMPIAEQLLSHHLAPLQSVVVDANHADFSVLADSVNWHGRQPVETFDSSLTAGHRWNTPSLWWLADSSFTSSSSSSSIHLSEESTTLLSQCETLDMVRSAMISPQPLTDWTPTTIHLWTNLLRALPQAYLQQIGDLFSISRAEGSGQAALGQEARQRRDNVLATVRMFGIASERMKLFSSEDEVDCADIQLMAINAVPSPSRSHPSLNDRLSTVPQVQLDLQQRQEWYSSRKASKSTRDITGNEINEAFGRMFSLKEYEDVVYWFLRRSLTRRTSRATAENSRQRKSQEGRKLLGTWKSLLLLANEGIPLDAHHHHQERNEPLAMQLLWDALYVEELSSDSSSSSTGARRQRHFLVSSPVVNKNEVTESYPRRLRNAVPPRNGHQTAPKSVMEPDYPIGEESAEDVDSYGGEEDTEATFETMENSDATVPWGSTDTVSLKLDGSFSIPNFFNVYSPKSSQRWKEEGVPIVSHLIRDYDDLHGVHNATVSFIFVTGDAISSMSSRRFEAAAREWRRVLVLNGYVIISALDLEGIMKMILDPALTLVQRMQLMKLIYGDHVSEAHSRFNGVEVHVAAAILSQNGFCRPRQMPSLSQWSLPDQEPVMGYDLGLYIVADACVQTAHETSAE